MIDSRKIKFLPAMDPLNADFMLIIGRPYIGYWESRMWPVFKGSGKTPVRVWSISLDSIPLLRLYALKKA